MLVRKQGPSRLTHNKYYEALISVATAHTGYLFTHITLQIVTQSRIKKRVSCDYLYYCILIGYGCDGRKYQLIRKDIHSQKSVVKLKIKYRKKTGIEVDITVFVRALCFFSFPAPGLFDSIEPRQMLFDCLFLFVFNGVKSQSLFYTCCIVYII